MPYNRKQRDNKMENMDKSHEEIISSMEEIEENIKKVIEIDKMLEETQEKLEMISPPPATASMAPTGKVFLSEEDKRLFKKFNQHILKKLGISTNRSYRM